MNLYIFKEKIFINTAAKIQADLERERRTDRVQCQMIHISFCEHYNSEKCMNIHEKINGRGRG